MDDNKEQIEISPMPRKIISISILHSYHPSNATFRTQKNLFFTHTLDPVVLSNVYVKYKGIRNHNTEDVALSLKQVRGD